MLTIDTVKDLVFDRGIATMEQAYDPRLEVWRQFCKVSPVTVASDYPYGHREQGVVGLGQMAEFEDDERIAEDEVGLGYVRQSKVRQVGTKLVVGERLMRTRNAEQVVMNRIVNWAQEAAKSAILFRNDFIAGMFQKGTIAAGSTTYFDGSYAGQPDANKGFIYDGKPWFAASAAPHPANNFTVSGAQGVNLVTSGALSTTTLNDGYTAMTQTNAFDERGNPYRAARPSFLIVPPALRQTAIAVTESELIAGSGNNDVNAYRGLVQPIVWDDLSDTASAAAWWLVSPTSGVHVLDSGIPDITMYRDDARRQMIFEAKIEFSAFVEDWRHAYCSNKAST